MYDPKTMEIITEIAYKELKEDIRRDILSRELLDVKMKEDIELIIGVIKDVQAKHEVPFNTPPVNAPRGTPAVGDPCKTCGTPLIQGKNGKAYCKPCYVKWAEANKR